MVREQPRRKEPQRLKPCPFCRSESGGREVVRFPVFLGARMMAVPARSRDRGSIMHRGIMSKSKAADGACPERSRRECPPHMSQRRLLARQQRHSCCYQYGCNPAAAVHFFMEK